MNRAARLAWGGVLSVGAASAILSASCPSSLLWVENGHEYPVIQTAGPTRVSEMPQDAPTAASAPTPPPSLSLTLMETVTDPDDTRAAASGDHALWVATGGGLLRIPYDGGPDRWWTTADGLPDHRLTAIARDGERLAVGTEAGTVAVLRLNGDEMPIVDVVATVSDSRVSDLLFAAGGLYASTWGEGVFFAEDSVPERFEPVGPSRGMHSRRVTSLAYLDGELLAGTAGAGLWVKGEGRPRRYVEKGGLAGDFVLDLLLLDGRVWVATPTGLSRYGKGQLHTWLPGDRIPASMPRALGDDDGAVRLGLPGGRVGRFGSEETEALPALDGGDGMPPATVRWFARGGGRLWAGTDRGVLQRGAEWAWIAHEGPVSNDVTSVASRDGALLVGTFDRGASLRRGQWEPIPLPNAEVNDVALDAGGVGWLATSAGLAAWDGAAARRFSTLHGLAHEHVGAVAVAERGLLVASTSGVQRFDGGFGPLLGGAPAATLSHPYDVVAAGDGAWVGTLGGLWEVGKGSARHLRYETGELPDNWINGVVVGSDGRLWAGTYDRGLAVRDADGWHHLTEEGGLPCGWVNPGALAALPDGSVLVGTMGGGLLRLDGRGVVQQWMPEDGLAGDDVTSIAVDGEQVWVGTRSGLSRLEVSDERASS